MFVKKLLLQRRYILVLRQFFVIKKHRKIVYAFFLNFSICFIICCCHGKANANMLFVFHIERISNVIDYFLLCVKKFNLQSIILAKLFQVLKTPLIYLFVYVSGKVIPRGQSYKLPLFFEPFFTLEARFWKEMESRSCYNARHCVIILDPFALLLSSHTALNSQRHVIN